MWRSALSKLLAVGPFLPKCSWILVELSLFSFQKLFYSFPSKCSMLYTWVEPLCATADLLAATAKRTSTKSQCPPLSQASSLTHSTKPASSTKLLAQIHSEDISELQFLALDHTGNRLDHKARLSWSACLRWEFWTELGAMQRTYVSPPHVLSKCS